MPDQTPPEASSAESMLTVTAAPKHSQDFNGLSEREGPKKWLARLGWREAPLNYKRKTLLLLYGHIAKNKKAKKYSIKKW